MVFRVCRHIKTNGLQCQSPALREDKFCYFHTRLRRLHRPVAAKPDAGTVRPTNNARGQFGGMEPMQAAPVCIEIGLLEDTASVQVAISAVVNALATNRLELRRATALLYGLQLASSNCRNMPRDRAYQQEEMLRETMGDSDGDPIAIPGMNSGNTWHYADDTQGLYEAELEELRLDWESKRDTRPGGTDDPAAADEEGDSVSPGEGDVEVNPVPGTRSMSMAKQHLGDEVQEDELEEEGDGVHDVGDAGGCENEADSEQSAVSSEAERKLIIHAFRALLVHALRRKAISAGKPRAKSPALRNLPLSAMQSVIYKPATIDVQSNEELAETGEGAGAVSRLASRVHKEAGRVGEWLRAALLRSMTMCAKWPLLCGSRSPN